MPIFSVFFFWSFLRYNLKIYARLPAWLLGKLWAGDGFEGIVSEQQKHNTSTLGSCALKMS